MGKFAEKWVEGDNATKQRRNWKELIGGTGADLLAIDYTANLTSRYAFGGSGVDAISANNLTLQNAPAYVDGVYGQAVRLNGSTQYGQASGSGIHNMTTGSFTITGWIKRSSDSGVLELIAAKRDASAGTNAGYRVGISTGDKLFLELCDGSASVITVTGATSIAVGKWYWFAAVFNRASTAAIFLGAEDLPVTQDAASSITTQALTLSNAVTFTVGRSATTSANFFTGDIDQLQVFTAVVTLTNLNQIFGDCHSGMLAFCEIAGSGFLSGTTYQRDEENIVWDTLVKANNLIPAQGEVRFGDADSSNYVGLKAPAVVTVNNVWTLPAADGRKYDYMATDGVAALSFESFVRRKVFYQPMSADDPAVAGGDNDLDTVGTSGGGSGGLMSVSTSTSSGNNAYMRAQGALGLTRNKYAEMAYKITNYTTSLANYDLGFYDGSNEILQAAHQSATFQFDTASTLTITNWVARCGTGAAQTRVDTTISASVFATRDFYIATSPTDIQYYIDDVLRATLTTNLPGATFEFGLLFRVATATSNDRLVDITKVLACANRT